ncbi:MAG TPA: D-alanyl-D-alanine carboxypeptidase [Candidatus Blautia excrementipullorum]|nr:D-alanyl-D-alanine carboxypeptidase [Candidatus Blautia excrementipullorum]
MNKKRKKLYIFLLIFSFLFPPLSVCAQEADSGPAVSAPSYVLMEPDTGTVICEKEKDTKRSPASVTKVMTLLLIFDHLEDGSLKLSDSVTTSTYAKSMGGSQVFLEEGEVQSVETMIKCIVVASGNDASVAMAEHIAGSEASFVKQMNERAAGLGMKNTHFEDCCGLTDSDNHYTTAYDIALMSRELILKYPEILKYSSIWMENITHVTAQGSKEFGLTNTNKLIRTYEGCVGLKTGSTSKAKFCISAVARRKDISLISVVMAAPDSKTRQKDAAALFDYGFARCSLYTDEKPEKLPSVKVKKGVEETVPLVYEEKFQYLDTEGQPITEISKKRILPSEVKAPVRKGQQAGEVIYYRNGEELGKVRILYADSVSRAAYTDCLEKILDCLWL